MKKLLANLFSIVLFLSITSMANATLLTIGTAGYDSDGTGNIETDEYYNLIWDDDDDLVWLDFTNFYYDWDAQMGWAAGLDTALTINLVDDYIIDWDDDSWRLPTTTVDGAYDYSYDGTTTAGYKITSSEMGHLYYEELDNVGYYDTSGTFQADFGLNNTGDFDNLIASWYWSGTEYASGTDGAWGFGMYGGHQYVEYEDYRGCGLGVRSGQVSASSVPEPGTFLLVIIGLIGFVGLSRRKGV